MLKLAVVLVLCVQPAQNDRQVGVPIGKGTTPPKVTLTSPPGGWTVGRMLDIAGEVSDPTVDPVLVSINGDRYLMRTFNGKFSRAFPAASGRNVVTVTATNKGGSGSAQATSYAQIPPVGLKAVLTSDTDGVYTDLHIYEPTDESQKPDGTLDVTKMRHVYWANTSSPSGGTFYLNEQGGDFDQPAYGPYLYVHRAPPKGVYLIATNYWPSGDKAHTLATLNVTLFEGTPQELKRRVQIPLATRGTTRVLAWVNVLDGQHGQVYVPSQDPAPQGPGWPSNLAEAAVRIQKGVDSVGDYGGGDDDGAGDDGTNSGGGE